MEKNPKNPLSELCEKESRLKIQLIFHLFRFIAIFFRFVSFRCFVSVSFCTLQAPFILFQTGYVSYYNI